MKREGPNYSLFDHIDTPEYGADTVQIGRIYQQAMKKAALPAKRRPAGKRMLLVAALVAVGALFAAAGYFTASDALRGYLGEWRAGGNAAELSSLSPIVDLSGKLLDTAQPAVSGNLRATPKAIAGDDSSFILLIELETVDGKPLGLKQADGSYSDDILAFRHSRITSPSIRDTDANYRLFSQAIATNIQGSRAEVLQRFDLYQPVRMGETIHVELGNLWQHANLQGKPTGIDLSQSVARFPAVGSDGFAGSSERVFSNQSGTRLDEVASLRDDSEISIPLGENFSGYPLTNAAVHDGALYLRGQAPADARPIDDLRLSALVSESGDLVIPDRALFAGEPSRAASQPWCLVFDGVDSLEQLQGLSWVACHGESIYPHTDGRWEWDVLLDYTVVEKRSAVRKPISINGQAGILAQVVVTPYQAYLDFVPDDTGAASLERLHESLWEEAPSIRTADGAVLPLELNDAIGMPGSKKDPDAPVEYVRVYYNYNDIIDPAQVAAVLFGDASFAIE